MMWLRRIGAVLFSISCAVAFMAMAMYALSRSQG